MATLRSTEGYTISSLDEIGEGYGFRKIRKALGVTAFGANALVMPPGYDGFMHYHDARAALSVVPGGRARFGVGGAVRALGRGSLVHVESTTPRKFSSSWASW